MISRAQAAFRYHYGIQSKIWGCTTTVSSAAFGMDVPAPG
jgi:hypothetical protein